MKLFLFGMLIAFCSGFTYIASDMFQFIYADTIEFKGKPLAKYLEYKLKFAVDTDCDNVKADPVVKEVLASNPKDIKERKLKDIIAEGKLGTIILISAVDCKWCTKQMPSFLKFARKNSVIKCINIVLGVKLSREPITPDMAAEKLNNARGVRFIFDDKLSCYSEFFRDQARHSLPMYVFLKPNGEVLAKVKGVINWDETSAILKTCKFAK